jgi:hypothetical protein
MTKKKNPVKEKTVYENSNVIDVRTNLQEHIKGIPMYYDPDDFEKHVSALNDEQRAELLKQMQEERNFYKNILAEPYRQKKPNSYRYFDAQFRIDKLNPNGKLLKNQITN